MTLNNGTCHKPITVLWHFHSCSCDYSYASPITPPTSYLSMLCFLKISAFSIYIMATGRSNQRIGCFKFSVQKLENLLEQNWYLSSKLTFPVKLFRTNFHWFNFSSGCEWFTGEIQTPMTSLGVIKGKALQVNLQLHLLVIYIHVNQIWNFQTERRAKLLFSWVLSLSQWIHASGNFRRANQSNDGGDTE